MSWVYRNLLRPILFKQSPEQAHARTLHGLSLLTRSQFGCDALSSFFAAPSLPINVFGLEFPNPLGLAAGMDKFGEAVPAWAALGFGFTELGAVTWHEQPGNPQPRLFRVVRDEAIINRMGFNNPGARLLAETLSAIRSTKLWPNHPVGINLGKSKITALADAPEDYANSFRVLRPLLDFFVVNVSSPNTPNLRQLQDKSALDEILAALQEVQKSSPSQAAPKPILVKIAPDLAFDAIDEIIELATTRRISGIIATNTTIARPKASDSISEKLYSETGGLSGRPLRARSTEIIRHIHTQTKGALPVVGVGGIFSTAEAWEKIVAGASLLQLYTGLIYEGPGICRCIVSGLLEKLEENGFTTIEEAIGSEAA
jgi:dihydroorotate dehydrogenase